jgi:hypothetical protein
MMVHFFLKPISDAPAADGLAARAVRARPVWFVRMKCESTDERMFTDNLAG